MGVTNVTVGVMRQFELHWYVQSGCLMVSYRHSTLFWNIYNKSNENNNYVFSVLGIWMDEQSYKFCRVWF